TQSEVGVSAVDRAGDPWRRGVWLASATYVITFAMTALPASAAWRFRSMIGFIEFGSIVALYWLIPFHLLRLARRAASPSLELHARLVLWAFPIHLIVLAGLVSLLTTSGLDSGLARAL